MSVGRSIFRAVGIRNSSFGALELIWNPEATRKLSVTLVCAPRCAATAPTGAIETDGALPDCAEPAHATASSSPTHFASFDEIIVRLRQAQSNPRRCPILFLL